MNDQKSTFSPINSKSIKSDCIKSSRKQGMKPIKYFSNFDTGLTQQGISSTELNQTNLNKNNLSIEVDQIDDS